MSKIFEDNSLTIGHTPLVRLNRIGNGRILAKVESRNPSFSVKCRIGANMIWDAEKRGVLKPGVELVEPTSGNTGIALAYVAAARGYKLTLTMPETMSIERRKLLLAYGAKLVLTEGARGMSGAIAKAEEIAASDPNKYVLLQQFKNPANPAIHEATTGPEIWEASDHQVTHFVAGIGTGGTISGTGRYLKEASDGAVQVIGADPEGSIYSNPNDVHQYSIEGVGEDFYPKAFDRELPDEIVQVNDAEAFEMTRRLAAEEGLLVGGSSGMAVTAALKYAREHDLDEDQLVVVLLPDSGRSYMEKIFNDDWMRANGFADVVERTSKPSLAEQYL